MTNERKYRKPPVIEALCEIFFADSHWDDAVIGQFYDRVKDRFPTKRRYEIHSAEFAFQPSSGTATAGVRQLPPRMQFVSEQGNRILQVAPDLLIVNQLPPYPHFEAWEPTIHEALSIYREIAQPRRITQIGLRYIDRIVIPTPQIDMKDYFTIYPQVPEHGHFMMRVEVPTQNAHTKIITFASVEPDSSEQKAFLLDLYDIHRSDPGIDFDRVAETIHAAHENIITVFEGSMTERLRQLFEPEDSR